MATNNDVPREQELRSKSLTSINTITSLGFPEQPTEGREPGDPLDDDSYSSGSSDSVCLETESHNLPKDVICLLVMCERHGTMAFKQIVNDCYYLPTFQFDGDAQSLSETVRNVVAMHDPALLNDDFEFMPRLRLIDLYRVELFKTRGYVSRYIFQVVLHKKLTSDVNANAIGDASNFPCICSLANTGVGPSASFADLSRTTSTEETVWIGLKSIPSNLANIWGGEPFKVYIDLLSKPLLSAVQQVDPYRFIMTEVDSSHPQAILDRTDWLRPMTRSMQTNLPNIFNHAVFYLYNEFVVQCFPSNSMGLSSFGILLDKLGLLNGPGSALADARKKIFRSLDRQCRFFLSYEDLCIGLVLFDCNNDALELASKQEYIFRYYDTNSDGRLEYGDYRNLVADYLNRSSGIEEHLKRLNKTRQTMLKEMIEDTWSLFVERNGQTNMSSEQYLKAFEHMNRQFGVNNSWLPSMALFEAIYVKFNCRNFPTTPVQHIVDLSTNYNRCEVCSDRKFMLSSSLIQLSDIGNILKIFHLKATIGRDMVQLNFAEEFKEKNIHGMANEFLIRIEKIGMSDPNTSTDPEDEDNAKNYFFPTRHKMLKYLHVILEHAKPLIDKDPKVIELNSPCFVFGDLNGSLKDLLRFSQTVFRTFPFIDPSNLVFLGNYTDAESTYNLECLIYLICLKILSPTRIYLLRGSNELAGRQQIQMQDQDNSDEPLNDVVCSLLAQIFDSFPIACVIEDSIFVSHSGIPKEFTLTRMKLICEYISTTSKTPEVVKDSPNSSLISVASNLDYQDLMEELLLKVIIGEPSEIYSGSKDRLSLSSESLFSSRDFEQFISSSKLFFAIRSHQVFSEEGFRLNDNFNRATIVSSTNGAKVPVCIYIDNKRIRLIRFDTNY